MKRCNHATTELMGWLMDSYGFDERGASLLLGEGMEYEISNWTRSSRS